MVQAQSKVKPLGITETVLRDSHQSLLATRMTIEDMIPSMEMLDEVGYWSLEVWGGATFDSAMRFLNEDPWERLRTMKKRMPKTRLQMLLRGQNILGYRHYADDIVERFVAQGTRERDGHLPDLRRPERRAQHGTCDARGRRRSAATSRRPSATPSAPSTATRASCRW